MFSDDYRYYLWKTIHIFVYIVLEIIGTFDGIKSKIKFYFNKNVKSDKKRIEECQQICDKIPRHIVLILGEKKVDLLSLSNIISWVIIADIKCVSIYDYTGAFSNKRELFFKHLEKEKNLLYDASSKNLTHGSVTYKNGVQHSMSLNILDPRHSKFQMSQLCRHIARINDKANHLNINFIDKIINEFEPHVSDPELGIYFDDVCCTFGLLPWQLRLTEFIRLEYHSTVNITQFLDTLYSFAKCEQRFGK